MARRHLPSRAGLLLALPLGATLAGCRADDAQCRDLARHIVELAEREGEANTAGTAVALEGDCKAVRPSAGLVECMMQAQSLAELDAC